MLSSLKKSLLMSALLPLAAVLFSSCGSTFMVAADDVYGTVPTREQERRQRQARNEGQTPEYAYSDSYEYQEDVNITDTFDYDNYYDYEYSSRLRRFQNDDFVSDDYYSDYYTNTYWYDNNPNSYGTSIYLGYDWWYPRYTYYRPGWYLGFGFGPFSFSYGYGGYWGCSSWWPSYAWDFGHGYHHGYWNGYWDGYWDGHYGHSYDYCYNPYDRNTYTQSYYGRRTRGSSATHPSVAANSGIRREANNVSSSSSAAPSLPATPVRRTFAERYEHAVGTQPVAGTDNIGQKPTAPAVSRRASVSPSAMMESVSTRLDKRVSLVKPSGSSNPSGTATPSIPARRANPSGLENPQRGTMTQTQTVRTVNQSRPQARPQAQPQTQPQARPYSSPVYDRSRSSSSYVSPRYNSNQGTTTRQTTAPVRQTTTAPRSVSTSRPATTTRSTGTSTYRSSSSGSSSSSSSGSTTRRTR